MRIVWFQQECCHVLYSKNFHEYAAECFSRITHNLASETFFGLCDLGTLWPLTFSVGYTTGSCFPVTKQCLRTRIQKEIVAISLEGLLKAIFSLLPEVKKCIVCEGGHLTDNVSKI
jgi:hypothetical protein